MVGGSLGGSGKVRVRRLVRVVIRVMGRQVGSWQVGL